MPDPYQITPSALLDLIATPTCPMIIDVTIDADFEDDPFLIPGATRHPHTDLSSLLAWLGQRPCITVCQKGAKLSQGVAAWLRQADIPARYLIGGQYGWRDWPVAPRLPAAVIPPRRDGATLWVTPTGPSPRVLAALWLIRRLVDRAARILFVAPDAVPGVAERFGATPIDDGSFERWQAHFTTPMPALAHMRRMITDGPEAPGLGVLFSGVSSQFHDDTAKLDLGLRLCDALYHAARANAGSEGAA